MSVEFNDAAHYGFFMTGTTLTSGTGKYTRQSELTLAALRAQGVFDNMEDGTVPPATDKLWLDKNTDPAVLKEWDATGSAWAPMTFDRLFGRAIVTPLAIPTGTGNAVVVAQPVPFIPHRMYSLTPIADNSGAATIQVTGVGTYDVKYTDGTALDAQEFKAGNPTILLFTGTRFEVLFALADIYAIRDQVVAIAAQFPVISANTMLVDNPAGTARETKSFSDVRSFLDTAPYVEDRTVLKALDTTKDTVSTLTEDGRAGSFFFDASDLSAEVTLDTEEIGYVPPTSDPTGATGAWRRNLKLSRLYPEMGGVIGDDVDRVDAYLDMQKVIDFAAREGSVLTLAGGGRYRLDGFLLTRTNLWVESEPGAMLRPTEWSIYKGGAGAFLCNVVSTVTPDLNVQSGIRVDLAIDGSLIPGPTFDYAVSSTANTVTLPATFDGKIRAGISRLTILVGTGIGENKLVTAWNAGTRVATVNSNWVAAPDATSFIGEGANDNGFGAARGMYNSDIRVVANDFMPTGLLGGSGGKGAGFEKGCRNLDVEVIAERCGWAGWVQGVPGVFGGYSPANQAAGNDKQWARDIRINVRAKDCQSAFGLYGVRTGASEDPDGTGNSSFVVAKVMARNCGHAVTRALGSLRDVKSGILTIAEGSNARITLDSVIDADFAPVWPSAPFVGTGETGTIGAVVQGWGQDLTIDARHVGACDSLYNLDRCRAMYDDASPSGIIQKVYGLNVKIKHEGTQPAKGLLWQQGQLGNVPTDQITANFEFDTNYHPSNVCGLNVGYLNINVRVTSHATGSASSPRGVVGTASRIKNEDNDITLRSGVKNLQGFGFGDGLPIRHLKTATATHDPGTIANLAEYSFTIGVPGVAPGSNVFATVSMGGTRSTSTSLEAAVTATDTVTVYLGNYSGGNRTPGSRTFFVSVFTFG